MSSSREYQTVRNCLGLIENAFFFNIPKCNSILLEAIANSDLTSLAKPLKRLCATQWVERYTAVNYFISTFSACH